MGLTIRPIPPVSHRMTREEAIREVIEKRCDILEDAIRQGHGTEYVKGLRDAYWAVLDLLGDTLESIMVELEDEEQE